jgi:hypothetical protein
MPARILRGIAIVNLLRAIAQSAIGHEPSRAHRIFACR